MGVSAASRLTMARLIRPCSRLTGDSFLGDLDGGTGRRVGPILRTRYAGIARARRANDSACEVELSSSRLHAKEASCPTPTLL